MCVCVEFFPLELKYRSISGKSEDTKHIFSDKEYSMSVRDVLLRRPDNGAGSSKPVIDAEQLLYYTA